MNFQLFGIKPCEVYCQLTTEEFADRFMATIRAPDELRQTYIQHLTLLVIIMMLVDYQSCVITIYFFIDRGNFLVKLQMPETTHLKNFVNGSLRVIQVLVVRAVKSGSNSSRMIDYQGSVDDSMYVPHDDGDQHGSGGFLDDGSNNRGGFMSDAEVSSNLSYNPQMHTF